MTPQCFPSNDFKPLGKVAGLAPIFTDAPNIIKENFKKISTMEILRFQLHSAWLFGAMCVPVSCFLAQLGQGDPAAMEREREIEREREGRERERQR